MKVLFMIMDILLQEDDHTVVAGIQFYIDLQEATLKHYFVYTPRVVGRVLKMLQQAYPLRIRGLSFAFAPMFFDFVYSFFKYAITEKIRKRVSIYSDYMVLISDKLKRWKHCSHTIQLTLCMYHSLRLFFSNVRFNESKDL